MFCVAVYFCILSTRSFALSANVSGVVNAGLDVVDDASENEMHMTNINVKCINMLILMLYNFRNTTVDVSNTKNKRVSFLSLTVLCVSTREVNENLYTYSFRKQVLQRSCSSKLEINFAQAKQYL